MCVGAQSAEISGGGSLTPESGETKAQADNRVATNYGAAFIPAVDSMPAAAPDLTDTLLSAQDRAALIRQRQSQGRRSSFLTGPDGEMSTPAAGKGNSMLGGDY